MAFLATVNKVYGTKFSCNVAPLLKRISFNLYKEIQKFILILILKQKAKIIHQFVTAIVLEKNSYP